MYIGKAIASISLGVLISGCGTFALMRPADTLKKSEVELGAAYAMNSEKCSTPVLKFDWGITNQIELGAQVDILSYQVGARYGILSSDTDPIALTLGLGVGEVFEPWFVLNHIRTQSHAISATANSTIMMMPSLTLGRRWSQYEIYLAYKSFINPTYGYGIDTLKLGGRYILNKNFFFGLEIGPTRFLFDQDVFVLDGAIGIGIRY